MSGPAAPGPEPTGFTIDGTPWEEPRGPHLPDAIGRVPKAVWPFLALAAVQAYIAAQAIGLDASQPLGSVLLLALTFVPPIATALLGAAYFYSRRNGASADPVIAIAVTLIALEPLLRTVGPWVTGVIDAIAPVSEDVFADMWRGSLYTTVASSVGLIGMALLWLGLRNARRRPDAPHQRRVTAAVFVIAVAAVALGYVSLALVSSSVEGSTLAVGLLGSVVNAGSIVVSAGVASVLLAGSRAGESPLIAWRLAAAGFLVALLASVPAWAFYGGSLGPLSGDWLWVFSWILVIVGATSSLLWLAAFVLGLPSDDPRPDSTRSGDVT